MRSRLPRLYPLPRLRFACGDVLCEFSRISERFLDDF
jgi:hypothetical protein